MLGKKSNGAIVASLVLAVICWGGSNVGTKHVVAVWPAVWTGATRLLCAGLILLAILRWTNWLGPLTPLNAAERRGMWWRGGMSLAVYMVVFNYALQLTAASHVALYLGTSPIWPVVWEERPGLNRRSAQRYGAALLAVAGVVVLFWPSLRSGTSRWIGEVLGVSCSVLWALYGWQCRTLGGRLSGAELSAHTLWRGGVLMLPWSMVEIVKMSVDQRTACVLLTSNFWRADLVWAQVGCIIAGGVFAYALWNNALSYWPTSQVFLFNNLIPVSTMTWSHFCLGEPVTPTFGVAMVLIVLGVVLGRAKWERVLGSRWLPTE